VSEADRIVRVVLDNREAVRCLDVGEEAGVPSAVIALVSTVARLERREAVIVRRKHRPDPDGRRWAA